MPVFSLKHILEDTGSANYRRATWLLLDAVRLHPVVTAAVDDTPFRKQVEVVQQRLQAASSKEEMLVAVGLLNQTLQNYNASVAAVVKQQEGELQDVVAMLAKALTSLGSASQRSSKSLEFIEVHLRRAKDAQEFQQVRTQLEECLSAIHFEADRQKSETQRTIDDLREKLARTHERLVSRSLPVEDDSVTGLPQRRDAENAITRAVDAAEGNLILVAVLSSLYSINARFGRAAGDELFSQIAGVLSTELSPKATLFRWTGPAIIAIFQKSESAESVRVAMRRILQSQKLKSLSYFQETTFINISITWNLVPLLPSVLDTIKAVDQLVESQTAAKQPTPA
jgi:GGDEF domain-containing protein